MCRQASRGGPPGLRGQLLYPGQHLRSGFGDADELCPAIGRIRQALDHKDNIVFNQRNHLFAAIYVFQRYTVDPSNGRLTLPVEDDLGPDYQLETVWERRFTPLTVSRISRVVSIREGPTTPPVAQPRPLEGLSPEEQEKVREQFLDRFIKRLP